MNRHLKDFIGVYDDVIPEEVCQRYIDIAKPAHFITRNDEHRSDKQLRLDGDFVPIVDDLYKYALEPVLNDYVTEFPYLDKYQFVSSSAKLQITEPPSGGYHTFHAENIPWISRDRVLAWMVYLNTIDEGGETEFLYQARKINPKAGRVVIWPASFTHLHRGNPPRSTKYIINGWWQGDYGLIILKNE